MVNLKREKQSICVDVKDALLYEQQLARDAILEQKAASVYSSLIWPTPAIIMGELSQGIFDGKISQIFATDAKGRVDPAGEFYNFEGIVEYFYGAVWTGATGVSKIYTKKSVVRDNIVGLRVDIEFDVYDPSQSSIVFSYNMTQTSLFTFGAD